VAHVFSFRTARFDVSAETPNRINPIAGESVLLWLRSELSKAGHNASEPDTEDWGWYMNVKVSGASYLIGASADPEATHPDVEWVLQIEKLRSVQDKLLGRNRMDTDDPFASLIETLLRTDDTIKHLLVDRDA
jgi:hypothetical protein